MTEQVQVFDSAERERTLKSVSTVSYALHTIVAVCAVLPGVQASVLLLLVAFVLDLVKQGDATGTWQESHFRWRIRTVIFAGLAYLLTSPLWLLLIVPGWIAWGIVSIWFLYRVVKGGSRLNGSQSMPT